MERAGEMAHLHLQIKKKGRRGGEKKGKRGEIKKKIKLMN